MIGFNSKSLKQGIKDSEIVVIKNCAHNAHMEKPKEFNDILLNFLRIIINTDKTDLFLIIDT